MHRAAQQHAQHAVAHAAARRSTRSTPHLDGLGEHLPRGVEVRVQARGVELQLADAAQRRRVREQAVPDAWGVVC